MRKKRVIFLYFGDIRNSAVGPAKYFQRLWLNKSQLEEDYQIEIYDRYGAYNHLNSSDKTSSSSKIKSAIKKVLEGTSHQAISSFIGLYLYYYRNAKSSFKLMTKAVEGDVDIIYTRDIFSMYLITRNSKFESSRKILTLANNGNASKMLFDRLPGLNYISRIIIKKIQQVLSDTDTIILLSNDAKKQFKQTYPIHLHEKIRVLYNGIPDYDVKKNNRNITPTNDINFITVGTISKRKGHDIIVKAVNWLIKNGNTGFKVTIIGEGDYSKTMQKEIRELDLIEYFEFKNKINNVENFLIHSDCYIQASRDEGMPISLIEAMSIGLPAVVSNIAAMPEMIIDQISGYLFESGNYISLAEKMKIILTNKNLKEIGQANREQFLEKFTLDKHLSGFFDILNDNKQK